MNAAPPNPSRPIFTARFTKPEIRPVDPVYNELQKAVLPVVGFRDGALEPFATAFCVSIRLSMAFTAWHVVSDFLEEEKDALADGTCQLAVLLETDQDLGGGRFLGGPVPVWQVTRLPDTDLAVLQLYEVKSGSTPFTPVTLPISFQEPTVGEWCYGFGYPLPTFEGGSITDVNGLPTVQIERSLHVTAGRILAMPPGYPSRNIPSTAPYYDCNAPGPHRVSGGPFLTDSAGLCGLLSSGFDPHDPDDRWVTYVSLLTPLLGCPVVFHDGSAHLQQATIHDLAVDGYFEVHGPLPAAPPTADARPITLPPPKNWG